MRIRTIWEVTGLSLRMSCGFEPRYTRQQNGTVAQLGERRIVDPQVAGAEPVSLAIQRPWGTGD
jgi:hypothetical protein